jgi:hypothetical protein
MVLVYQSIFLVHFTMLAPYRMFFVETSTPIPSIYLPNDHNSSAGRTFQPNNYHCEALMDMYKK